MEIWICSENCLWQDSSGREILPYVEVADDFSPSSRLAPYVTERFSVADAWCQQIAGERKRFLSADEIREWYYHGIWIDATRDRGRGHPDDPLTEADIWRFTPPFSGKAERPKTLRERGLVT